ncbi:L,D-transpeptidase [Lichenicola cladoniae]|uniref:L,D-transpeptidase n=1 Tax=Lichenicola cladoniae TaxID=1484109 RepID=A0A6M8HQV0_9PROT|nr:L,D-transpeptidase [Lichenicola cladoniae]NPD68717.1 L,D-transpeptidase [Acetobacteraceae bacterium]QKE90849.1 L,D-transpeptidase [Lichenicola cladoniae]
MSTLSYDGTAHQITFKDRGGRTVGTWTAYNNTDRHATLNFVPSGTYSFADTHKGYPHRSDPNGPYGSFGILRFNVPGHTGVGVHSGRAAAVFMPGPPHQTMGCIRTTDEAMGKITAIIGSDPLSTIAVTRNSAMVAQHGVHIEAHHAR